MTQDELYEEFTNETKHLKDEMELKVRKLELELAQYREPFDREFQIKTSPKKEAILPHINEIESQHKYACHKIAVRAHKAIDKLEKKRQIALAPYQSQWESETVEEREWLDAQIEDKVKEHNAQVQKIVDEFNELNKPAHEAYLAKAKELELKELNTPVVQED